MRADSLIAEYQGVKSIKGVSRVSREYQGSIKSIKGVSREYQEYQGV
jgi:hypothetical protein